MMTLQHLLEAMHARLEEVSHTARVVLLHPASRYRSAFVAYLLGSSRRRVLHYALSADDIDVTAFLNSLMHGLSYQNPSIGRSFNLLPRTTLDAAEPTPEQMDTLVQGLVKELSDAYDAPYYLILDEYDRSDSSDTLQAFIEQVIDHLPANCVLIINSRTLPRLPWISGIVKHSVAILRDTDVVRAGFHSETLSQPPVSDAVRLDVFALGPGFVLINDKPIESWEGHLPRLLFFFALDRPIVTRSEICRAFWPDLQEEQAVNVFHVTKRRLHKALNIKQFDTLVHQSTHYRINEQIELNYDAAEFAIALINARDRSYPDRAGAWLHAIDTYRGQYLQGHFDPWIIRRRLDYQRGYLEALTQLAQLRQAEGRIENALIYYQRALQEMPHDEGIHRMIMRAYASMGRHSEITAHYHKLAAEFTRINRPIAEETRHLFQELLA